MPASQGQTEVQVAAKHWGQLVSDLLTQCVHFHFACKIFSVQRQLVANGCYSECKASL